MRKYHSSMVATQILAPALQLFPGSQDLALPPQCSAVAQGQLRWAFDLHAAQSSMLASLCPQNDGFEQICFITASSAKYNRLQYNLLSHLKEFFLYGLFVHKDLPNGFTLFYITLLLCGWLISGNGCLSPSPSPTPACIPSKTHSFSFLFL